MPEAAVDGTDKRDRILDAAQNLFLRYGVKRTSIEDVAQEAGIAKGTVYLSFESKAALFAAIADRLCAKTLADVRRVIGEATPLAERLVGMLDCYIGATHRLVAQSPHIAELTASKEALAAVAFDRLDKHIRSLLGALLGEAGITRDGAADMFLAAGLGTLSTGYCAEEPYRARLTAMVDTLLAGLTCGAPPEGHPASRL
ncbi:transcriptional regulator, TetR family [Rhizobiales bacterium GAS113]|nr:transcriptional regulator, TetR family [Rhizobiales bacterium GAS113]